MWSKNGAEFLNGATLVLDASFGYYQTPIQKNVYFVAEDTLIFLSGKHIIEYDIIRKKESYILKNLDDESIVAMNYYLNKKKALSVAVAMRSTSRVLPQVITFFFYLRYWKYINNLYFYLFIFFFC